MRALALLSAKCGFGPNYFSYSRQQGLRTATEVSSDNSQLFRTVRKHEQVVGETWKPFDRPVENPGANLDRKAAEAQMAALG